MVKSVRAGNELRVLGRVGWEAEGGKAQRDRQLIRRGDDSPMLGIYSISQEERREEGKGREGG